MTGHEYLPFIELKGMYPLEYYFLNDLGVF